MRPPEGIFRQLLLERGAFYCEVGRGSLNVVAQKFLKNHWNLAYYLHDSNYRNAEEIEEILLIFFHEVNVQVRTELLRGKCRKVHSKVICGLDRFV